MLSMFVFGFVSKHKFESLPSFMKDDTYHHYKYKTDSFIIRFLCVCRSYARRSLYVVYLNILQRIIRYARVCCLSFTFILYLSAYHKFISFRIISSLFRITWILFLRCTWGGNTMTFAFTRSRSNDIYRCFLRRINDGGLYLWAFSVIFFNVTDQRGDLLRKNSHILITFGMTKMPSNQIGSTNRL